MRVQKYKWLLILPKCLQNPNLIDPSELLRPEPDFVEKSVSKFRDYSIDENDPLKERVRMTYTKMHRNQTVDFVKGEYLLIIWHFLLVTLKSKKIGENL